MTADIATCARCGYTAPIDSADLRPSGDGEWADWFCTDPDACGDRFIQLLGGTGGI